MALQLLVALLAIRYGADLTMLLVGMGLTLAVSCLLQRHRVRAIYGSAVTAAPAPMTADVRAYVLPLSIVAVLDAIVWDRSEVFFLGLYASSEEIAYYSLAFGLATRIMIIPGIAVGALLPAFSTLHGRGDPEDLGRLYTSALRYVALVGVPLAAMVAALAPSLVVWLYGDAYLPAAPLVGVLAAVAVLSALRQVTWAALRGVGDRRSALVATAIAAAVNVGLAAALIPGWGTTGAVVANAIGQVTAAVWAFAGIARTYRLGFPIAAIARTALVGLLAWFVAWALAGEVHDPIRLVGAATLGLGVFVLACVPARLIGPREWGLLTTSTRRLLAMRAPGATAP
jgi:O-antigen/teichoic acid export membrane protein